MSSAEERADALRADIERTREELGETVAELAHKVDVPARMRESRLVPAVPLGAVVGAVLALLAYLLWRRH